jgi:hypothetical protein
MKHKTQERQQPCKEADKADRCAIPCSTRHGKPPVGTNYAVRENKTNLQTYVDRLNIKQLRAGSSKQHRFEKTQVSETTRRLLSKSCLFLTAHLIFVLVATALVALT